MGFPSDPAFLLSLQTAVNNIAYLVTECKEHIGPKLSILACRRPTQRFYRCLAATFLDAPVRFHHGNFELSPEYANALTFWFVGLFLLVFGLKLPGAE